MSCYMYCLITPETRFWPRNKRKFSLLILIPMITLQFNKYFLVLLNFFSSMLNLFKVQNVLNTFGWPLRKIDTNNFSLKPSSTSSKLYCNSSALVKLSTVTILSDSDIFNLNRIALNKYLMCNVFFSDKNSVYIISANISQRIK